jgi:hypothetical protein
MKVTYQMGFKVTVDRDAAPFKRAEMEEMVRSFFANPTPLPSNVAVSEVVAKNVMLEE